MIFFGLRVVLQHGPIWSDTSRIWLHKVPAEYAKKGSQMTAKQNDARKINCDQSIYMSHKIFVHFSLIMPTATK